MEIKNLISELKQIDAQAVSGSNSLHFIDVVDTEKEVVISGNKEGLIHLALQLLVLAQKDIVGSHYHLDEASIADKAEKAVVFVVKTPPWA